jgi:hypothetical protein
MSPCDEYKRLVKEWQAERSSESYWRPENQNVHGAAPDAAKETAESFRKQAGALQRAMEEHVKVCGVCKNS